jgi:hypothetical protein
VIAYKFLDEGRVAPFARVSWPEPGEWLESEAVELCVSGVHACRVGDLPYWLRPELWEVELEGDVVEGERLVAARRGRLVRRVRRLERRGCEGIRKILRQGGSAARGHRP